MVSSHTSKNIWLIGIITVAMAACTAFAWGSAYADTTFPVTVNGQGCNTLKEAVDKCSNTDPGEITLNEDVVLTETVKIEEKRITINLNTHKITGDIDTAIEVSKGTLTITESGEIKADTPVYLSSGANLEIKGNNPGAIKLTGAVEDNSNYAVDCDTTNHDIKIKNASLVGYEGLNILNEYATTALELTNVDIDAEEYGIFADHNSEVTISGGTVEAGHIPLMAASGVKKIETKNLPAFKVKDDSKYETEWSGDRFAYKEKEDTSYTHMISGKFKGSVSAPREKFIGKGSLFSEKPTASWLAEGTVAMNNMDEKTKADYPFVSGNMKLTIHWSCPDWTETDDRVSFDVTTPGKTVQDVLDSELDAGMNELHNRFYTDEKYHPYMYSGIIAKKPIDQYETEAAARADSALGMELNEDIDVYLIEMKRLEGARVEVKNIPKHGTAITGTSFADQSPAPEVSISGNDKCKLEEVADWGGKTAVWVKEIGERYDPYFIPSQGEGPLYIMIKPVSVEYGSMVAGYAVELTVDGKIIGSDQTDYCIEKINSDSFPYMVIRVKTEHNFGEWNATQKATQTTDGSMERKCDPGCNFEETDTIHHPETIALAKGSFVYNGKEQEPEVTVTYKDGEETKAIDPDDYKVKYADNVNAGTGKAIVTFRSDRYEMEPVTLTFKITKAANTMTVKGKTIKISKAKVKKKTQTIKVNKAFTVKGNIGKVTYGKKSGNKKITVSKAGKVTVKKGLKKGTYKVKVNVTAAGDANHNAVTKLATVVIRVK